MDDSGRAGATTIGAILGKEFSKEHLPGIRNQA